jgi:hypothetical protein
MRLSEIGINYTLSYHLNLRIETTGRSVISQAGSCTYSKSNAVWLNNNSGGWWLELTAN